MSATATASTILTSSVQGRLVTGTEVAITARQHEFTIDEPDALGGTDKGANPIEHLLAALASCTVISYQVWADSRRPRERGRLPPPRPGGRRALPRPRQPDAGCAGATTLEVATAAA